jgi:hypothetical protein
VASVSGTVLAVCSCTVLPLFAGIYRMGAGIGPATAFLYSGPAINVLAIILTARILGMKLGVARAVGAIGFSVVIGLLMHLIFRKEEQKKADAQATLPVPEVRRPLWQTTLYFAAMVAMLVVWFGIRWWKITLAALPVIALTIIFPRQPLIGFAVGMLGLSVITSLDRGESGEWFSSTWGYAKQIMPLLLFGVLIAGALLGRPGQEGLIPSPWISGAVGGNSLWANLFAAVAGAFMYFATLTEVPIVQGLLGSGMGQGPALALLLAGPALSLPSMLVIRSIMGTKKTLVFISLVVVMATVCGLIFGAIVE